MAFAQVPRNDRESTGFVKNDPANANIFPRGQQCSMPTQNAGIFGDVFASSAAGGKQDLSTTNQRVNGTEYTTTNVGPPALAKPVAESMVGNVPQSPGSNVSQDPGSTATHSGIAEGDGNGNTIHEMSEYAALVSEQWDIGTPDEDLLKLFRGARSRDALTCDPLDQVVEV